MPDHPKLGAQVPLHIPKKDFRMKDEVFVKVFIDLIYSLRHKMSLSVTAAVIVLTSDVYTNATMSPTAGLIQQIT